MKTKLVLFAGILSIIISLVSCDGGGSADESNLRHIAITDVGLKSSTSLFVDGTEQLTPTISPSNATNQNVTWSTSNDLVVDVNDSGYITGIGIGVATVTVITEDGNHHADCVVTVSTPVAVTDVNLQKTSITIFEDYTELLEATIEPINATNQNLSWDSDDSGVATVSPGGLVTGIAPGEAKITVTTEDNGFTAECTVIVLDNRFITTWNTAYTGSGTSDSNQIMLPLDIDGNFDFNINWGDGETNHITAYNQSSTTHTYATEGVYEVTISGIIEGFGFSGVTGQDNIKLVDVEKWGSVKIHNKGRQFSLTTNLSVLSATDMLILDHVTNMNGMFYGASAFNQDIGSWDVSNVTDMQGMFYEADMFNQDIGGWDVGNVINMAAMFSGAGSFNQNIGSWDVANVIDMAYMFNVASAFNQDIGEWDVSNVRDMGGMFSNAISFNQDIGGWDVGNVVDMNDMFSYISSFNQDIGGWDVANVMDMSYMFYHSSAFNMNLDDWTVSSDTYKFNMFSGSGLDGNEPLWFYY